MVTQLAKSRPCPVCGSADYSEFAKENINPSRISTFTYASRKQPEFMCHRLVLCKQCDLIYTPAPPDANFLSRVYEEAAYDSSNEAMCAARSYAAALLPHISNLPHRLGAVDVGAGSGPLLPWLNNLGFDSVIGIEPSSAAISAAPEDIRAMLRKGVFIPEILADVPLSLICSFMTFEHIPDPGEFTETAYDLLEPGGVLAVVTHNWRGILNRALGLRSPIIDIEHLQLFSPRSVRTLFEATGFEQVQVKSITNSYPLRYWLRLTPLPTRLKTSLLKLLETTSLGELMVSFPVGNIIAVGRKPLSEEI